MHFVLFIGILSLVTTGLSFFWVIRQKDLAQDERDIPGAIREGSRAYLSRLYLALIFLVAVIATLLWLGFNWKMAIICILGAICAGLSGFIGMSVAVRANSRTTRAALSGVDRAFLVAYRAGGVPGLAGISLGLIGTTLIYLVTRDFENALAFSLGASSFALPAKAGGGIYTKTADIAADLVGKFEHGIPEDDPRNAAVIADMVGDNVGDVAGTGADMLDSYVALTVGALTLGSLYSETYGILPLILCGIGILSSLVGIGMLFFKSVRGGSPESVLNRATLITNISFALLVYGLIRFLNLSMGLFWVTIIGTLAIVVIGFTADYFTRIDRRPVREIAQASTRGSALNILSGFKWSQLSVPLPMIAVALASFFSAFVAKHFGIPWIYGVAISGVGMLAVSGTVITADAYGPICDNARGIAEMTGQDGVVIRVTDELDAAGNTVKAIAKGVSIGAAAATILTLLFAYGKAADIEELNIFRPDVLAGVVIGAAMIPAFSGSLIGAVEDNAVVMVDEVRRQFDQIPGLLEGKTRPDYATCVGIAASGAMRALARPVLQALLVPPAIGFLLGKYALGGFLAGAMVLGLNDALWMANAGGAWDNAKKYVESSSKDSELGGPGSDVHKASIVGDTVGDPLKDTAGPSINTFLAVISLVSVTVAPLISRFSLWFF